MKILHSADWHSDANLEEFIKCSGFLIFTAREEEPDLIIIAGDVFNSRDIKLDSEACKEVFKVVYKLSEIAPCAIVTGTPSHEGHSTESLVFASAFEHNIKVSSTPEQFYLHRGQLTPLEMIGGDINFGCQKKKPDAIISMMPTPTKQFLQGTDDQISQAITPIFSGFGASASEYDCPHILVYHGTIRGATLASGQTMTGRDIEISKDQLALGEFDLVTCGHIHLPQEIKPNIFYSGSLFPNTFGEDHEHGFYIHEITENKASIEPIFSRYSINSQFINTPSRRLVNLGGDFTGEGDDIRELDAVLCSLSPDEVKGASVKVSLKVWQDMSHPMLNKQAIEVFYKSAGAKEVKVEIKHVPRETVRSEVITQLDTLADKLQEQAKIKAELLPEGVKDIAIDLETLSEDELYAKITAGYTYGAGAEASAD